MRKQLKTGFEHKSKVHLLRQVSDQLIPERLGIVRYNDCKYWYNHEISGRLYTIIYFQHISSLNNFNKKDNYTLDEAIKLLSENYFYCENNARAIKEINKLYKTVTKRDIEKKGEALYAQIKQDINNVKPRLIIGAGSITAGIILKKNKDCVLDTAVENIRRIKRTGR